MPTRRERKGADLRLADQHIADCERHVAEHEHRIGRLREDGHDVTAFEAMLTTFKDTLATQRHHREMILERIAEPD